MNSRESLQQMLGLTLVVLLLAGCGRAPAGRTVASTPSPPTVTPAEALATQPIEDTNREEIHKPAPPMVTTAEIQSTEQPIQDTSLEETDQNDSDGTEAIQAALLEKTGIEAEKLELTVAQNTGTHAKGTLKHKDDVSGAYFIAAKVDSLWVIAYDGQAVPSCAEIASYNFPVDMVPECLDGENNLVVRTGNQ